MIHSTAGVFFDNPELKIIKPRTAHKVRSEPALVEYIVIEFPKNKKRAVCVYNYTKLDFKSEGPGPQSLDFITSFFTDYSHVAMKEYDVDYFIANLPPVRYKDKMKVISQDFRKVATELLRKAGEDSEKAFMVTEGGEGLSVNILNLAQKTIDLGNTLGIGGRLVNNRLGESVEVVSTYQKVYEIILGLEESK